MKAFRWASILLLSLFVIHCSQGGRAYLFLRYQPLETFSTLREKTGATLGMAPIQDNRKDTLYVGFYAPYQGNYTYFKSDPPLDSVISESLAHVLPPYGIKVSSAPRWDGNPESLPSLDTDSILLIKINQFWIEGKSSFFQADVLASVRLTTHLGVKKEGKVFTRNIEAERQMTVARFTPGKAEELLNQRLREIFDAYCSNPY